jgi:hypothetical protein
VEAKAKVPNPGSDEAIDQGCSCPVLDNSHGKTVPFPAGQRFWITTGTRRRLLST